MPAEPEPEPEHVDVNGFALTLSWSATLLASLCIHAPMPSAAFVWGVGRITRFNPIVLMALEAIVLKQLRDVELGVLMAAT